MAKPEPIDVDKLLRKRVAYNNQGKNDQNMIFNTYFFQDRGKLHDADSVFFDPFFVSDNAFGNIRTISRVQYGGVHCKTLRAIAEKAWIINLCIGNVSKKIKPFMKPVTDKNQRGFIISKKGEDLSKLAKNDKERDRIKDILLNTGSYEDPDRDDFVKYIMRITRDILSLDQVATEIQYNKKGDAVAFFAVDAATVEKVVTEDKVKTDYRYMQIVEGMAAAAYTHDTMVFDFENPRSDIRHSMYGYSYVEQAVDLITSTINAFVYNAGNFTENKLPKGMLLLNGDADQDRVDEITDYICELMSGGPASQWRIPVIPSGDKDSQLEWKPINQNREMEFQAWLDYLTSGVIAMFGCSADELGIQSQKSQTLIDDGSKSKLTASKGLILGDLLVFYESYLNKIISKFNKDYCITFCGYEIDDPSKVYDNEEKEGRTRTTVNELRERNGQKPLDLNEIKNPADLPMNPQLIQAWQSLQAQQMGGDGGMPGADGGEENQSWADYGDMQMGDDMGEEGEETDENAEAEAEEPAEETPEENDENVQKSILII